MLSSSTFPPPRPPGWRPAQPAIASHGGAGRIGTVILPAWRRLLRPVGLGARWLFAEQVSCPCWPALGRRGPAIEPGHPLRPTTTHHTAPAISYTHTALSHQHQHQHRLEDARLPPPQRAHFLHPLPVSAPLGKPFPSARTPRWGRPGGPSWPGAYAACAPRPGPTNTRPAPLGCRCAAAACTSTYTRWQAIFFFLLLGSVGRQGGALGHTAGGEGGPCTRHWAAQQGGPPPRGPLATQHCCVSARGSTLGCLRRHQALAPLPAPRERAPSDEPLPAPPDQTLLLRRTRPRPRRSRGRPRRRPSSASSSTMSRSRCPCLARRQPPARRRRGLPFRIRIATMPQQQAATSGRHMRRTLPPGPQPRRLRPWHQQPQHQRRQGRRPALRRALAPITPTPWRASSSAWVRNKRSLLFSSSCPASPVLAVRCCTHKHR